MERDSMKLLHKALDILELFIEKRKKLTLAETILPLLQVKRMASAAA
jgi:hypothetical protein